MSTSSLPSSANTPAAAAPAVTVVIQTYNRSNILPYAIGSVLWQRFRDWELLVIGDGCTDDSAAVVARFTDPRIRFINLAERVGDQSGPNNEGVRQARGRYVAYLNHDDLWFPDHLERVLPAFDDLSVDVVFTMPLEIDPDGRFRVNMVYPDGFYDPRGAPPISSWVVRRDAYARWGLFRHRDECWSVPTQDWLFRAWRRGARILHLSAPTVLVINSAQRRNTYSERQDAEQRHWYGAIRNETGLWERALAAALSHPGPTHLRMLSSRVLAKSMAMRLIARCALALRVEPEAVYFYLTFPKRWGFLPQRGVVIRELYRRRGLPPWTEK